jgi:hypothetical protein
MISFVMPWLATGPGDVTLLTARGQRLTKKITPEQIIEYDNPALFSVDARRLDRIEDIAELLLELAEATSTCIIRATLRRPLESYAEIRRWLHDRGKAEAWFVATPRAWVMVDIEPDTAPAWIDSTDPVLVGGWLRRQLPGPFRMARCVVQLSSGAGIKAGLRAHLWFWLDRALGRLELERLLAGVDGLDPATLRDVQVHYVAAPVFVGVDDPVVERIAILPGYAEVKVPDLMPASTRPALACARPVARRPFAPPSSRGGFLGSAERYAEACLRRLALAPEGQRHHACLRVACRLLAIARAGQLDPVAVGARIIAVMLGRGLDRAEIDSILNWAWQRVGPEELPHVR